MKVTVDAALCNGHGECVIEAPEVFTLPDDSETVELLVAEPDEALREKVTRAAALCPVAALIVEG
ncbi:ferredoxin [Amycolatopsis pithecellobii]|uniref:Ferredoxin n=1 Tax=Amycolatopsis pithecellobii TaxID=664692 RepID=A0A6N7Z5J4_9PSEU|nr:ferredoxin [Amycolatopsis pithecellobii]MTD54756.1 ferredoxin [Amycolatopsis pithecellobii]